MSLCGCGWGSCQRRQLGWLLSTFTTFEPLLCRSGSNICWLVMRRHARYRITEIPPTARDGRFRPTSGKTSRGSSPSARCLQHPDRAQLHRVRQIATLNSCCIEPVTTRLVKKNTHQNTEASLGTRSKAEHLTLGFVVITESTLKCVLQYRASRY